MLANTQGEFKETFRLDVPTPCKMVITVKDCTCTGTDEEAVHEHQDVIFCPKGGTFTLEKLQEKTDKKKA